MSTTRLRARALSLALLAGGLLPLAASAQIPADGLRAGFGVAPLPAPLGAPLAGYGGLRDRTAEGVLDAPEARALVLDRAGLRVALVVLDLVIIRPSLRDELLEQAPELGVDAVVLTATHTHSGPGAFVSGWLAERVVSGDYDPEAPGRLARAAGRAMERAVADLAPARVASTSSTLDLARNRRFADGPAETALPVLRIDAEGRPPILLFAYGAHPIVLSPASRDYSADYVGAARAWLEERGWRAIFIAGPLGDQAPGDDAELWPDAVEAQRAQAAEIGARLGSAAAAAASELQPEGGAELAALERWVEPPDVRLRRFCAFWWVGPLVGGALHAFMSERVPLHALRVGDAALVGLPGEPTSDIGKQIRQRMPPGRVPFVIAHANDWIGYVVTPPNYQRGGYEACMSFHGPGGGPWLVEEATETLRLLESGESGVERGGLE